MEATSRLLSWVDLSSSDVVLEVQRSIASLDLPTILNLTPRDSLLFVIPHLEVDQLARDQDLS